MYTFEHDAWIYLEYNMSIMSLECIKFIHVWNLGCTYVAAEDSMWNTVGTYCDPKSRDEYPPVEFIKITLFARKRINQVLFRHGF